jgi:hypothetical protein
MHDLEPFYNWHHLYRSEDDEYSPYYGTQHSEFTFTNTVYNYYIHPQWDEFGSNGLYLKILFVDYEDGYCIIEFIGEWNDVLLNDGMLLKRNIIDLLIAKKIYKYILIIENVLNLFCGDADYYEEWLDDIKDEDGYITWVNMHPACMQEYKQSTVKRYINIVDYPNWRTLTPMAFYEVLQSYWLQ